MEVGGRPVAGVREKALAAQVIIIIGGLGGAAGVVMADRFEPAFLIKRDAVGIVGRGAGDLSHAQLRSGALRFLQSHRNNPWTSSTGPLAFALSVKRLL